MRAASVLALLRITRPTLTRYVKDGKIKAYKKSNGRYEYDADDVYKIVNMQEERETYIYVRVSTDDMMEELEDQINKLKTYCISSGIKIDKVATEVSTPFSVNRHQFFKLIRDVSSGRIGTLVVMNKYRLGRESCNVVEELCLAHAVRLIYVDKTTEEYYNEMEIGADLIAYKDSYCAASQ